MVNESSIHPDNKFFLRFQDSNLRLLGLATEYWTKLDGYI